MYNVWSRRTLLSGAAVLALLLLAATPQEAAQQDQDRQTRYAIERAQIGVSGKIIQERGGDWADVTFDQTRTQTWRVSDRVTGVRGEGRYTPREGGNGRAFTYEATVNHRNGSIQQVSYEFIRGGGGAGGDRRVPRWLVGSFNGRNPWNRRRASVTVGSDGAVSAIYDNGARDQGTYDNGRIRFNNSAEWDVSRVEDGFRAAYGTRSEVFSRTSGDDDADDDGGRVPRWMRGTFRGTTDSGESELIIRADGTATARSLRTNRSFRGIYSGGVLRFDWGSYEVTRLRDGIRTTDINNRNQTDYRRTSDY